MKEMSWQKKEEHVRKVLSEKFGVKFEEREVRLRGTDKPYRFDLVSLDGSIIGEVTRISWSFHEKNVKKALETGGARSEI